MHLVLSRMERIGSTGVVASRSFQNILSVLYKDGLGRFVGDLVEDFGGIVLRDLERGLTLDIALYQVLFDCNFV